MKLKRCLALITALTMVAATALTGCGKKEETKTETPANTEDTVVENTDVEDTAERDLTVAPTDTDNYIELALNVYYNDSDSNFYDNVPGESIFVTEEGQYTLSFDCDKNLTPEANAAGVIALKNLTAIYILDMGSSNGSQSPLKACNIKYDSVVVDGTELTITKPDPKAAFKGNGIFDTNDPINAWEGSAVEEVNMTDDHVANFTTIDNPKTISVTFTLSDMDWDGTGATTESTEAASGTSFVNPQKYSDMDLTNVTSVEVVKLMGNGINLGNTMEACNTAYSKDLDVSKYETVWGQPVTTKEMIVGMKNMGFDTIRIPVAWTNMMDYKNGDYTINTALIDRVQQIVDWAIEAEMFVIVNDHWDSGWWDLFTEADNTQAWNIYENMWNQVGERFKDYPDTLILESANEELGGKFVDKGLTKAEAYELTTAINQKFVDIIRGQGSNNSDRFLLIAGYNTNIDDTCNDAYVMPTDTVANKLIISVHYYDPWNYCGDKSAKTVEELASWKWGLKEEYQYMSNQIAKMNKFTDAGYGVIIGEYGALCAYIDNASHQIPNAVEYNENMLRVCEVNGICPVLWDCNNLFNKSTLDGLTPEMRDMYIAHCYANTNAVNDNYVSEMEAEIAACTEAALDTWPGQEVYEAGTPVAWIMWNGGAGTYSVGDKFNSADCTGGITASNAVIADDGSGEYTVSLSFSGGNNGLTFAALAIADGELLFPGAAINIKSITMDGNDLPIGKYYTTSDDKKCTRVNLYNGWCGDVAANPQENFRTVDGSLEGITATPVDPTAVVGGDITITFELVMP